MTIRDAGLPNDADDALKPEVEQNAARMWVEEYHKAMAGDRQAQADINKTLKEWAHAKPGSLFYRQEADIRRYMKHFDKSAAAAFNKAVMDKDGSIQFRK